MGAHYGSIQIRSTDQEAVLKAVETVARARKIKCLIGPAINGWVGVYPEMNGQDDAVGADLAKNIDGIAIHILIHDDDVMAYWLWRDGELVDRYWSRPGYFGEAQRATEEQMAGARAQFASIIGEKTLALAKILSRDREMGPIESERLEEFAQLLGIRNALTAYEYLKEGETEGVKGWQKFREVPEDIAAAEQKKRERQTANKHARDRHKQLAKWQEALQSSGLVLMRVEREYSGPFISPAERGFAFLSFTPDGIGKLESVESPWQEVISSGNIFVGHIGTLKSDKSGRRFAATADRRLVILEAMGTPWTVSAEFTADDRIRCAALSEDAAYIAYATTDTVRVVSTASKRILSEVSAEDADQLYFHPDGNSLLAILHGKSAPLLISVSESPGVRPLYIGGKTNHIVGSTKNLDLGALIAAQRTVTEATFAQLSRMFEKMSKKAKSGPEANYDPTRLRSDLERFGRQQITRLEKLKAAVEWLPNRRRWLQAVHFATTGNMSALLRIKVLAYSIGPLSFAPLKQCPSRCRGWILNRRHISMR